MSKLKCKFLRHFSAWVKVRQISQVNFETTSQFLFKFCIIHECTLVHFLLWIKGSHRSPNFKTFEYSRKNLKKFLMSFSKETTSQFFVKFCIFSVMKHNCSVVF